jgi:hypothetical protein
MMADERITRLEEFLAARGRPLLQVAVLLGGGPAASEDLLHAALERDRLRTGQPYAGGHRA